MSTHTETEILEALKEIIASIIVIDPHDINPKAYLEDDLSIDMDLHFPRIIARINQEFDISLDTDLVAEEAETVKALLDIVKEEAELG